MAAPKANASVTVDPVERAVGAVEVFCDARCPDEFRDEVRLTCSRRGRSITVVEERPPWRPQPGNDAWTQDRIAQLRYDSASGVWSLYCCDSSSRWWPYDEVPASPSVDPLLVEIDRDPTGIFWG